METAKLKKFAQYARRSLIEQVGSKLAQVIKEESAERRELPNVVAKLENELKQKGKEYGGLCPFHNEKTPSFTVNNQKLKVESRKLKLGTARPRDG